MPQIPQVPTLQPVAQPLMSPGEAGRPGETVALLAEKIGAASGYVASIFERLHQRNVEEAIKHQAIAAENRIDAWHDQFAGNLRNRTDYQNWEKELEDSSEKQGDSLKSELTVPHDSYAEARLQNAIDEAMLRRKEQLRQLVTAKTSQVLDQQNILEFGALYNTALKQYVATPDPQAKGEIFKELTQKGQLMGAANEKLSNFVTNKLLGFKSQADEQQLFQDMGRNPVQTMKDLSGPTNLPPSGSGYPTPIVPGNVDWYNRPSVPMPGGKTGTVYSASREENGLEVLFPTIYDGKRHSEDEAWQHYKQTGEHMGKFRNVDDADAYAQKYHQDAAAGKFDLPYPNLLPERRAQLGESAARAAYFQDAQALAEEQRKQKEFELRETSEIDRLVNAHLHGKDVSADFVADMDHGILDSEGVAKATERIKTIDAANNYETREENPAVKADTMQRTYGMNPDMTEGELAKRLETHGINGTTYKDALVHLTETRKRLQDKGTESQRQQFEMAQRRLTLIFEPQGPMQKYAEGIRSLEAEALQQLERMVYKESVPAGEAVDKLNRQYGPAINDAGLSASRRARKALAIPGSDTMGVPELARWLRDHKGSLSTSAYLADYDLLLQIKAAEEQSKTSVKTPPPASGDQYAP